MNSPAPSSVNPPDDRLIDRAISGDSSARQELFERFRDGAYRTALRITGRHEDALDVVQDAFIKAFERLADFQREAGFKTWLLRIVSNRALDLLRSRKVRRAAAFDTGDDEQRIDPPSNRVEDVAGHGLEQRELAVRIASAVASLPEDQRSVFTLYASGELTYGEIAETLGIPIGTVMSRLFHARRKLHGLLGDLAPRGAKAEADDG